MQYKNTIGILKRAIIAGKMLRYSAIATAIFSMAFVFAPYIIVEASAANDVSSTISWSAIDLTLDPDVVATDGAADAEAEQALATHGDVEFGEIVPTSK